MDFHGCDGVALLVEAWRRKAQPSPLLSVHPITPSTATLGGLRTMRQGRRGGNRDVQEFLEEAVTPRGQFGAGAAGAGAGRGSGSYERFIKAHKETVLTEEDKRFKTWSSWKDQLEDFEDDGQEYVC